MIEHARQESFGLMYDYDNKNESNDISRTIEPWISDHEVYFTNIIDECKNRVFYHENKYSVNKNLYYFTSIPVIIIPIILSTFEENFNHLKYTRIILLITLAILSGISSFFNFGQKEQKHDEYANKYSELIVIIETEITKKKAFRTNVSVFTESIKAIYLNLMKSSP